MLKNTDCLLVLLIGDFKDSTIIHTIRNNFNNIITCNSYAKRTFTPKKQQN